MKDPSVAWLQVPLDTGDALTWQSCQSLEVIMAGTIILQSTIEVENKILPTRFLQIFTNYIRE